MLVRNDFELDVLLSPILNWRILSDPSCWPGQALENLRRSDGLEDLGCCAMVGEFDGYRHRGSKRGGRQRGATRSH
jgi:hypothetical protein